MASNPPAMYIGSWQEFALGRALARTAPVSSGDLAQRRLPPIARPAHDTSAGPSGAGAGGELQQFVAAFKEAAANMDEERASNLLRWSPLFLPTVQSLMQPTPAPGGVSGPLRGGAGASRPTQRSERTVQQQKKASIRAQRERHIQQMRALYSLPGEGSGSSPATSEPPSPFRRDPTAGAADEHASSPPHAGAERQAPSPGRGSCTRLFSPVRVSKHDLPTRRGAGAPGMPSVCVSPNVARAVVHSPGRYLEGAAHVLPHAEAGVSAHCRAEGASEAAAAEAAVMMRMQAIGERESMPRMPASPIGRPPYPTSPLVLPHICAGSRGGHRKPGDAGCGTPGGGSRGGSPVSRGSAAPWGKLRDEEWEEEVDDLLEWTRTLPGFA
jgi:hypothetical protein